MDAQAEQGWHVSRVGVAPLGKDAEHTHRGKALPRRTEPVPPGVQESLAPRFHYDFSQVRIHADEQAAKDAASMGARVHRREQHLLWRWAIRARTRRGRRLLAHELTHVIQADPAHVMRPPARMAFRR